MWEPKYRDTLIQKRRQAEAGGGERRIDSQHQKGKLTARERLACFFDKGSFTEINTLVEAEPASIGDKHESCPGDGVVIGYGTVNGRRVFASSQDFTVIGGTLGEAHSRKICHIMDMALEMRSPYVCINDSGGARIEEGIRSLDGYSGIFYRNTKASGVIPQISVILGPCAGGACYSPAITDFIFMSENAARMFITGPAVVKAMIGEDVTPEELGGARVHATKSGVIHFSYDSDRSCLEGVKKLLSYLPDNCEELPPVQNVRDKDYSGKLEDIVPDNQRKIYDMKAVIEAIVDSSSFLEVQEAFAKNIIIGFARLSGKVIGIVANNPKGGLSGSLDIDSSEKAARFVRFCDCFNIPLLTLVDVPGFLPGTRQEHGGIIRRGAKLLYAYAEATVPKVTLIVRKAFGGAYIAMNSKGMGADLVFAWPIAQTAVMGAEGAVGIMRGKELAAAEDPETLKTKWIQEYEDQYMTPYIAARKGYIDEVILPEETGQKLRDAFDTLSRKDRGENVFKRHGNIPL
ncbi:MAG: acyl-CoA carboxylase subunit beta [Clostridia bacterium]|nr:acyl-CoA carboxylase subunit beta [Clostridia bacterium]